MILFFELIQVSIGKLDALSCEPSTAEWNALYGMAVKQAVAGVCFYGIQRLPKEQLPPKGLLLQWFALAEQITRSREHLTAHDALVGKVVAVDYDIVQCRLLALSNSHFHVHGITDHVQLDRLDIEEEVSVVAIKLGNIDISLLSAAMKTFLHRNHVIDVTFLNLENGVQCL